VLPVQLVEQRLGVLQVGGVETFGEPVVNVGEHRARLVSTTLTVEQPREARRRAQFEGLCRHLLGERNRLSKIGLGEFGLACFEPQLSATGQRIGPVEKFLGIRLQRLLVVKPRLISKTPLTCRPRCALQSEVVFSLGGESDGGETARCL